MIPLQRLLFLLALVPALAFSAAPDLALKDLEGRARNVNEFIGKGKWTVVVFWAHDCPICKREIHQMVFFHDEHRKKDAVVLGVSVDGEANVGKARAFVEEHGLNFPNLIAEPESVERFGGGRLVGTPTHYIYSPDGELLARQIGPVSQEQVEAYIEGKSGAARAKE